MWKVGRLLLLLVLILPWSASAQSSGFLTPVTAAISFGDLLTPRRPVDVTRLGINAFVNDPRFGSIRSQFREIQGTLGIKHVRVLFAWNDQVQKTPTSLPFFGFYDDIVDSLPAGVDALIVVTGIPSWMSSSQNWIDGDPRRTFVERWVRPIVTRYGKSARVSGFEMWNEPNDPGNPHNQTMGFLSSPDTFIEFTARASNASKSIAANKVVVSGATTAIAQNFPSTLRYNQALVDGGILSTVDIYGVHFYGKNIDRLLVPGGVGDFLKSLTKSVWITESGEQGVLRQRDYAQRIFPYLLKKYSAIKRIYIYQFTDGSPVNSTYGLRTPDRKNPVSDLYLYLRDLVKSAVKRKH